MSNIDTFHNVLPFQSGKSKPFSGQRLARVLYKRSKSNLPSVCASVPHIPLEWVQDKRLTVAFVEYLEQTQDAVLKALYESKRRNLDRVSDTDIGLDAIVGYLGARAAGARLSGDSIIAWYRAHAEANVMVALAEKMGLDMNALNETSEEKLLASVENVGEILKLLAGKQVSLGEAQKRAINRVFEVISEESLEDTMTQKLMERFNGICNLADTEALDF